MIAPYKTIEKQELICNYCGKVIDDFSGSVTIDGVMPWLSKYDFDLLNMTLCPDCLDAIVDGCAVSPITVYEDT